MLSFLSRIFLVYFIYSSSVNHLCLYVIIFILFCFICVRFFVVHISLFLYFFPVSSCDVYYHYILFSFFLLLYWIVCRFFYVIFPSLKPINISLSAFLFGVHLSFGRVTVVFLLPLRFIFNEYFRIYFSFLFISLLSISLSLLLFYITLFLC